MKDKIIIFIVGLLLGAVISTGSIYFYTLSYNNSNSNNNQMQMPNMGGTPPTEQNGGGTQGQGQPPEMPNQNNAQNNTQSNN